ncbi:Alpha/Beta hydrolase protein [Gorgonomyces haynaldii]|nr:Alpha/Beta hydrolase protein [Gorgonomyces haynaldii]
MIPLPSDKNIMIHRGWTGVAKNLTATLSPIVERKLQQYPDANFLFSGHSSGAAWSALIAYYGVQPDGFLSRLGVAVQRVNLVTIGGPRLGNQAFVDSINNIGFSHVLRVVKSADPVAVLPPQTLFNFYAHDEELFINSVKESGDNVPVFCEDQQPSKVDGSCDKRLNAAQILLKGVDEFKQQHLFYLDIKLGDNSCV